MVLGAILRPVITKFGRYVYQGLRQQDKIIDYTYRKTGLYNRGVVRGIKHGLIAGQIIGGGLELGLNAPETPGNGASVPFKKQPPSRKPYQTRNRFADRRITRRCYPNRSNKSSRQSSFSKSKRSSNRQYY